MEILFRGKDIETAKWVYGFYTKFQFRNGGLFVPVIQRIKECDEGDYVETIAVEGETVGQYTGRKGNLDVRVFGGDIISFHYMRTLEQSSHEGIKDFSYQEICKATGVVRWDVVYLQWVVELTGTHYLRYGILDYTLENPLLSMAGIIKEELDEFNANRDEESKYTDEVCGIEVIGNIHDNPELLKA